MVIPTSIYKRLRKEFTGADGDAIDRGTIWETYRVVLAEESLTPHLRDHVRNALAQLNPGA